MRCIELQAAHGRDMHARRLAYRAMIERSQDQQAVCTAQIPDLPSTGFYTNFGRSR